MIGGTVLWIELLAGNRRYARVCVPLSQVVWWWEYFNNSKRIQHTFASWQRDACLFFFFDISLCTHWLTHINYYLSPSQSVCLLVFLSVTCLSDPNRTRTPALPPTATPPAGFNRLAVLVWIINYWNLCGWRLFSHTVLANSCIWQCVLVRACLPALFVVAEETLFSFGLKSIYDREKCKNFVTPSKLSAPFLFFIFKCADMTSYRDIRFTSIANETFSSWQAFFLSLSLFIFLLFSCPSSAFFDCNQAWHANKCTVGQGAGCRDAWNRWWSTGLPSYSLAFQKSKVSQRPRRFNKQSQRSLSAFVQFLENGMKLAIPNFYF